jgi:hypothetical protein
MPPEAMDLVIQQPGGRGWDDRVRGSELDDAELSRAIAGSGARALLIGRRALEPIRLFPTRTSDDKDPEDIRLLEALRKEDE